MPQTVEAGENLSAVAPEETTDFSGCELTVYGEDGAGLQSISVTR